MKVFLGISRTTYGTVRPPPDVTGHLIDLDVLLDRTLALAEKLQPDVRRLYVIAGSSPLDRSWQAIARTIVGQPERKFETSYLFELTYDEL